jgi:DNA-binding MurR/RpiR family transcriptional regulator
MRFEAMDRQVKAAFESSQRAIDKADEATEKRFEGVNEFRAALSDQATRFVTNSELHAVQDKFEANYRRNREDIDKLTTRINLKEGEEAGSRLTYANMAVLLGVTGGVVGTIVVLMNVLTT